MVSGAAQVAQQQMARQQQRELLARNAERLTKIANRIRAIVRAGAGALPSPELINLIYALARFAEIPRGRGRALRTLLNPLPVARFNNMAAASYSSPEVY